MKNPVYPPTERLLTRILLAWNVILFLIGALLFLGMAFVAKGWLVIPLAVCGCLSFIEGVRLFLRGARRSGRPTSVKEESREDRKAV